LPGNTLRADAQAIGRLAPALVHAPSRPPRLEPPGLPGVRPAQRL